MRWRRNVVKILAGTSLIDRVRIGIDGLDEAIGGGFPRGGLILLGGCPGTGKTVFSTQFLVEGARSGEPGIYVSFTEPKDTLIENLSAHLRVDLRRLESEGLIKILDYTTMKEEAVSNVLEGVLNEAQSLTAKRLVIDSYSALAQAFERTHDARNALSIIFGRIVRQMGCTTVMVVEAPTGADRIGLGVEEFVADGLLVFRSTELDERHLRELELVKLRGTRLGERKLAYTLERGFKAFPSFKPKAITERRRFQAVSDGPGSFSLGCKDLDEALGGGLARGSTLLLEVDEKVSTLEYHLFVAPITANFAVQGRGAVFVPSSGVDPEMLRHTYIDLYGGTEEEFYRYGRIVLARGFRQTLHFPNIVTVEGENWREDFGKVMKVMDELEAETGQPRLTVIGTDTMLTYYGERGCEEILNVAANEARRAASAIVAIVKAGRRDLAVRLSPIADVYIRLLREHGCLLMYGVKPRTGLYAVEMDVSKGYPLPKLTPIV
jgi:KaiC/GvpD/RAD55 family RecA-like ATPase